MKKDLQVLKRELCPGQEGRNKSTRAGESAKANVTHQPTNQPTTCIASRGVGRVSRRIRRVVTFHSSLCIIGLTILVSLSVCALCVCVFLFSTDEKDKAQDMEMKGFDDFQRKKHELNTLLQEIRVVRTSEGGEVTLRGTCIRAACDDT